MMLSNQIKICLSFFSLLLVITALPLRAEQELLADPQIFDSKLAERIILVTYADKHINRVPVGAVAAVKPRCLITLITIHVVPVQVLARPWLQIFVLLQ